MLRVLRSCMFSHSLGQEDQFSRLRLSGRSWFSQQTFAETRGNGQDAPLTVIGSASVRRLKPTPMSHSWPSACPRGQ